MSNRVITINRMFGSNGRIIGKALAEELGFKFYDKELIEMASREKNIPFDEFARVDERKASQWLYPVDYELQMNPEYHFVPMNDVLYHLQKKIILEAAEKENCVIVGRCGNYILQDNKDKHLSLFIYAPFEDRVKTVRIFRSSSIPLASIICTARHSPLCTSKEKLQAASSP